jgi:hypothetical protein
MTPTLYHFTCDHAWALLGNAGKLRPARDQTTTLPDNWWPADYVWVTDLAHPIRDALGLTNTLGAPAVCDRTAHRYRVTDTADCVPWTVVRRTVQNPGLLESAPGVRPRHWWVSPHWVPVVYDPLGH